jgi:hypothetical protein
MRTEMDGSRRASVQGLLVLIDPGLRRALKDSGRLTNPLYFAAAIRSSRLPLESAVDHCKRADPTMDHPKEPATGDLSEFETSREHLGPFLLLEVPVASS